MQNTMKQMNEFSFSIRAIEINLWYPFLVQAIKIIYDNRIEGEIPERANATRWEKGCHLWIVFPVL